MGIGLSGSKAQAAGAAARMSVPSAKRQGLYPFTANLPAGRLIGSCPDPAAMMVAIDGARPIRTPPATTSRRTPSCAICRAACPIGVQLTSDGHKAYLSAVERHSGPDIDYAMLAKHYGPAPEQSAARMIEEWKTAHH
jgi:hypothetical protein